MSQPHSPPSPSPSNPPPGQRTTRAVTLGAPAGTEIHYTLAGHSLQDIARETGWQLEQAMQPLQNRPHP